MGYKERQDKLKKERAEADKTRVSTNKDKNNTLTEGKSLLQRADMRLDKAQKRLKDVRNTDYGNNVLAEAFSRTGARDNYNRAKQSRDDLKEWVKGRSEFEKEKLNKAGIKSLRKGS